MKLSHFRDWLSSEKNVSYVTQGTDVGVDLAAPYLYADRPWLWMQTSGTTSSHSTQVRWVAHTRPSLISSAESICKWLGVCSSDRWGRVLTSSHMGGLAIDVRAHVVGFKVVDSEFDWEPQRFCRWVSDHGITVLSLVPTQVFDLCVRNLAAPECVRVVLVGGDRLTDSLKQEAIKLGWPVLKSYGLTETASAVACEKPTWESGPKVKGLRALEHAQFQITESGAVAIRSRSLFCAELKVLNASAQFRERTEDWWTTSDLGQISEGELMILGRSDEFVKVFGELVSLSELDLKLSQLLSTNGVKAEAVFVALPDERAGHQLAIVVESAFEIDLLNLWNGQCQGIERASSIVVVARLPRTALGKLMRNALKEQVRRG